MFAPIQQSHRLVFGLVATMSVAACGEAGAPAITHDDLQNRLNQLQAARPDVPGFALAVVLDDGTRLTAATGQADPDGRAMTANTPVRIASITKTFVAAAILRLWEDGMIHLDAPIAGLISAAHNEMLTADGYDTKAITIRHLLMHAGGVNDHFGNDAFTGAVLSEPSREWTRTEQLRIMVETTDPLGPPGEIFSYSDTGYLLLGEIVERVTGEPLGKAVKQLTKLDMIGLSEVWWDTEDAPPATAPLRAHQWLGDIDTYDIHGSVDAFGGGGIVADVEDMALFFAALFGGEIFEKRETLTLMTTAPGHPEGSPYRMGLFTFERAGRPTFGHGGFWGTDVAVWPEFGVSVAGISLNETGTDDLRTLETEIAGLLMKP